MEKITGIGGFFFLGRDSTELNVWYEKYLGITRAGQEYKDGSWWQEEGPTVFGAESKQEQIGGPGYKWRINFRVRDLDAMVAQLRAAGISVEVESTIYPNGRFAHLCDPDGNSIELWEPGGTDLVRPANQKNKFKVNKTSLLMPDPPQVPGVMTLTTSTRSRSLVLGQA